MSNSGRLTGRGGLFHSVLMALSLLVWSGSGHAQNASLSDVDQRLQRVERVLDSSLLELLQRIDGLQREIRQLRGEIESQTYELETLKKRNRGLYLDTDRRITELESGAVSGGFGAGGLDEGLGGGFLDETGSGLDETSGAGPVIVPETTRSTGASPPAAPVNGASTRPATQAEKASYTKAYDLLARGQNDAAVGAFDQFLREYPDGPYSDNAWYWQGEAKYAQRDFDAALQNFSVVVNSFPNSPKVPDARLKIGFALFEQQQYRDARKVLTGVQNDYPGRSAAVLARKRLQQMDRDGN